MMAVGIIVILLIANTFIQKTIMDFLKERMDNDKPVFVE